MVEMRTRNYASSNTADSSSSATATSGANPMPDGRAQQPALLSSNEQNTAATDITPPSDGLKYAIFCSCD